MNATAIANAIKWITDPPSLGGAGVKVINYSWGLGQSDAIENAVATAITNDVMIFAPVGNGNSSTNAFLSNRPGVLAVGGIDQQGRRWRDQNPEVIAGVLYGSNYGPSLRYVAPATVLYSTDRQGAPGMTSGDWSDVWVGSQHTISLSGTSFATPLVASVAALVRAVRPDLTGPQVDQILCETAVSVPNWDLPDHLGDEDPPDCGLIDATAAILAAKSVILLDGFESGTTNTWTRRHP
jgi:subtilisin family serine protease